MKSFKNIATSVIVLSFILALSVSAWIKPADEVSESERRGLAQFPELSFDTVLFGSFMKNFESYTLDQFPFRETFRTLKAQTETSIFNKNLNNDIFLKNDYISKMEYPLNVDSIDNASKRFNNVYEKFLKDTDVKVYFSIIPDKNYYLIKYDSNYLSVDYENLFTQITSKTSYMKYIDIFDELSIDSYYKTDTHWRQEKILPVAEKIAGEMGVELKAEYSENILSENFKGVYSGQYALDVTTDSICVLENDIINNAVVYDYQNQTAIKVYDESKCFGRDPYETYLGGPLSLITIENENATTDKELIIFRDSFGSSLAPLFIEGYKKITLVDIRYIYPDMLGNFIEFSNQDVLFIYSTSVLNNSETLK